MSISATDKDFMNINNCNTFTVSCYDFFFFEVPRGHGSKKLKREALEEVVMRVMESIRQHRPAITLPYCGGLHSNFSSS